MKTTTKILLGMGSYILASISGIAIASASDHIVNQLVTPSVSISNLRPAQTILIASRDEQGEDREDHEDDNDHENDNHHEE